MKTKTIGKGEVWEQEICADCGGEVERQECWDCGGEGFHDDLYEQDPLWYSPNDTEKCTTCDGIGGWYVCVENCSEKKEAAR